MKRVKHETFHLELPVINDSEDIWLNFAYAIILTHNLGQGHFPYFVQLF